MKTISYLITTTAFLAFSCGSPIEQGNRTNQRSHSAAIPESDEAPAESVSEPTKIMLSAEEEQKIADGLLVEFLSLYKQLEEFKGRENFKKYGFAPAGPYNSWLKEVQRLREKENAGLLMSKHGVLFGELEQLGMAYVFSGGEGNETSRLITASFDEALRSTN